MAGVRPPSAFAMSFGLKRAALRKGPPSTSSTMALAGGRSAPQPFASKPASATRSPSMRTAMRTRSPHAAPPAAPVWGQPTRAPSPEGASKCSANDRTEGESYRAASRSDRLSLTLPPIWRLSQIEWEEWPQPAVVGSGSWACCRSKSGCPPGRATALPRVGLPYRWYSAQHVRPTGEQARAEIEPSARRAGLPPSRRARAAGARPPARVRR